MVKMCFKRRTSFRQESSRKRRNRHDTFIHDYLFDAIDRKEDRIRLNTTFFTMRDVIHPILERIEVDSTNCYAVRSYVQQTPEESLPGTVQTDDDDGIQLHKRCISNLHRFNIALND